jgi:hypothetical protein
MAASGQNKSRDTRIALVYALFLGIVGYVFYIEAEGEFSSILTLSSYAQCFAFVLLMLQVHLSDSVTGISARGLCLEALALVCRLSSTMIWQGYLPADATGDYLYQLADIIAVAQILWLLYQIFAVKPATYENQKDTFPVLPVILFSFAMAIVFHADLNDRPFYDTMWMAGLFLSILAAFPQLSVIAQSGSSQALTSHHIAALALSRILSGAYMWHVREDITCHEWIKGFNHSYTVVLGVHLVHLVLLADFLYFYLTTLFRDGLDSDLQLEGVFSV